MDQAEIIQSIIDENRYWIDVEKTSEDTVTLKNDPYAVLTVGNMIKCRNNEVFRMVITKSFLRL